MVIGEECTIDCDTPTSVDSVQRPPLRYIDKYIQAKIPFLSTRHTLAVMTCLGFFISMGMLTNLCLLLVKEQPYYTDIGSIENNAIVSCFWGFLISQISGGILSSFFPSNRIFGVAILGSSIFNVIIPLLVPINYGNTQMLLLLQSAVHGLIYPAFYGILRFWTPPLERTILVTIAIGGSYSGVFAGSYVYFFLAKQHWKYIFYFYGTFGILWWMLWLWLIFEKPRCHPAIDESELQSIEKSLGESSRKTMLKKPNIPWLDIVQSKPVVAIVLADFCRSFGFLTLAFTKDVFFFLYSDNVLQKLPLLLMAIIMPCSGMLTDYLRKSGRMSTTNMRKLFTCGGLIFDAVVLFLSSIHTDSQQYDQIMRLSYCLTLINFFVSSSNVNFLDIASPYVTILIGLSSGISTIGVLLFVSPAKDLWKFREIAICAYFLGATYFGIFATGELEYWAKPPFTDGQVLNTATEDTAEENVSVRQRNIHI